MGLTRKDNRHPFNSADVRFFLDHFLMIAHHFRHQLYHGDFC